MSPGQRRSRRQACRRSGTAPPRAHDVNDVGVAPWARLGVSQGRFGRSFGTEEACQVFLALFKSSEAKNKLLKLISILYVCGA